MLISNINFILQILHVIYIESWSPSRDFDGLTLPWGGDMIKCICLKACFICVAVTFRRVMTTITLIEQELVLKTLVKYFNDFKPFKQLRRQACKTI